MPLPACLHDLDFAESLTFSSKSQRGRLAFSATMPQRPEERQVFSAQEVHQALGMAAEALSCMRSAVATGDHKCDLQRQMLQTSREEVKALRLQVEAACASKQTAAAAQEQRVSAAVEERSPAHRR